MNDKNSALLDRNSSALSDEKLKELLSHTSAVDVADLIKNRFGPEQLAIFNRLLPDKAVKVFEYLPLKVQKNILLELPSNRVAALLNALAPDDRTQLLVELPNDLVNQLLKYLSPEERSLSVKLLGYPPYSVGRLMTPDYIAIKMNWTVREVLDYIRKEGHDSETVNVIYAVDDTGKLIDDFRIRQFLFASLNAKVEELADHVFISLEVEDDEEKAINLFRKYDRVALPVIDSHGILLGIVTIDDIIDVAIKEDTEDMQKLGGVEALNAPYMDIPFFRLMKKRASWFDCFYL